ncbi:replication-relaxation family protein [Actinosynnema sp. NPDC023794]
MAKKLTDPERQIIDTLARGRAATARQLQRLHFTNASPRSNARMAQRSLRKLTDLRVVTRLERAPGGYGGGSAGNVYSLDVAGIKLANPDIDKAVRKPWPLSHLFLEHTLEVMEWYVRLVENERLGGLKVMDYTAEPKSWRYYVSGMGGRATLKSDAFVRLASDEWEEDWFLEIDRDTEHVPALERQLARYVDYWRSGTEQARNEVFPHVLWIVPSARRYGELVS